MAIDIEKRFTVDASVGRVWLFLTDLERVAECLEGATVTDRDEDGTWSGTMKVKLGPVSSTYRGTVRFDQADEDAHLAELSAEGRDVRGKGGADMTMRSRLTASEGGATEVEVASTVHVTGVLARMGRGMIEDVSDQLFQRFTACVREKLEGEGDAPERESQEAGEPAGVKPAREPVRRAVGAKPTNGEEALQLGGMGAGALGRAAARAARRPVVWIVLAGIALAVWWAIG